MEKQELESLAKCTFSQHFAFQFLNSGKIFFSLNSQTLDASGKNRDPKLHQTLGILRHISRIHGLPIATQIDIISSLQSSLLPLETQAVLAQSLKHAFFKSQPNQNLWTPLIGIIQNSSRFLANENDQSSKILLLSELVLALCTFHLDNPKEYLNQLKFLSLKNLNHGAKTTLLEIHQNYGLTFQSAGEESTHNHGASSETGTFGGVRSRTPVQAKVSQFFKVPTSSTNSTGRAHAVKAQQISAERTHEIESEAEALAALNLSKALNSRTKSSSQTVQKTSVPLEKEQSKSGSDRSYLRNTWYEVDFLQTSATKGGIISSEDQEYLFGKLWGAQPTSVSRQDINKMIADAFFQISKRQRIGLNHFKQLLELLQSPKTRYGTEEFQHSIVKMVENCIARDSSYFTRQCRGILSELMHRTTNEDTKNSIYDILRGKDDDSEGFKSMFEISLAAAKNENLSTAERMKKLDYVRVQALNKKRAEELFDRLVIQSLINLILNEKNHNAMRKAASECIENYLEHKIHPSALPLADMTLLSTILETGIDAHLQAFIIRLLLKKLQTMEINCEEPIPEISLVQVILSSKDLKVKATVLAALQTFSTNFEIPGVEKLAPLLILNDFVSENDLTICDIEEANDSDCKEDEKAKLSLSSMVIKTLLNTKDRIQHINQDDIEKLLDFVIQAINVATDKQTRIMSSEYLYFLAKFHTVHFTEWFLLSIMRFLQDSVPDVKSYCTWVFLEAAAYHSKLDDEVPLDPQVFEKVADCYILEKTTFIKLPSFMKEINNNVTRIMGWESCKSNSTFKMNAFKLLESLLETDTDERVNLTIIRFYSECHIKNRIPDSLVEVMAPMLLSSLNSNKNLLREIFEYLIQRGQNVPNGVIQYLADELMGFSFEQQEEYANTMQLFVKANLNQEFSSHKFNRVMMELWTVLFWASKSADHPLTVASEEGVWKQMTTFLENGNYFTQEGFRVLVSEMDEFKMGEKVLSCLLLAAANGQNIPEKVLSALSSSIENMWTSSHLFLKACNAITRNNQTLPVEIRMFLEIKINDGVLVAEILAILLLEVQVHSYMSPETLNIICAKYSEDITDKELFKSLIYATENSNQFSQKSVYTLSYYLFNALKVEGMQELAIEGITNLALTDGFELNDKQINTIFEVMTSTIHMDNFKTLRTIVECKDLSPAQKRMNAFLRITEIGDDTEFLNTLENFMKRFEETNSPIIKMNTFITQRLKSISCNEAHLKKLVSITLKGIDDFGASDLMTILENAASAFVSIENPEERRSLHEFLIAALDSCKGRNIILSQKLLRTLESNLNVSVDLLLPLIDQYQLSLETQLEVNLINLESSKNEKLREITFEKIPLLLSKGLRPSSSSIQRIVSNKFKAKCFTEILARLIVSSGNQFKVDTKMAEIFLHDFNNRRNLKDYMYSAMKIILKFNGKLYSQEQLKSLEDALVEHFHVDTTSDLQINMLECIPPLVHLYTEKKAPSPQLMEILNQNLVHTNPEVRLLAYQALLELDDQGIEVPNFEDIQDIIASQVEAALEEDDDWSEVESEVITTLMSLETWDFTILKSNKNNQMMWKQELILSNVMACFVSNPLDKLKFLEQTRRLSEKLEDLNLTSTALQAATKIFRDGQNTQAVMRFLESLEIIATHDLRKVRSVLESPELLLNVASIEETALEIIFARKCQFNSLMRKSLVTEANNKVGYDLSKQLVDSIIEINSFEVFERIIIVAQDLHKDAQLNLKDSSCNMKELSKQVEEIALVTLVHSSRLNQDNKRLGNLFVQLAKTELPYELIKRLVSIKIDLTVRNERVNELEVILEMILNYQVKQETLTGILEVLETSLKVDSWIILANQIIISSRAMRSTIKSPVEVVEELKFNLEDAETIGNSLAISRNQLECDIDKIRSGNFPSRLNQLEGLGNICNWKGSEIKEWTEVARKSFRNRTLWMSYEISVEALSISKQAFHLCTNFHLTNVQTVSLLLALNKGLKGQLQQVATGSGKSTIVAVLAAINSIRCGSADIYTSSPVLAERDAKSWAKFYALFGLTCSHNGDLIRRSYTRGLKQCYTADVVYGETSMFQFDYLRHHYSNLGTLGRRKNDFAIVDEADSMLVDDLSKLARLSSLLPGMDLIQILYHVTWQRVSLIESKLFSIGPDQIYFIQGKISYNEKSEPYLEFCNNSETGQISKIEDLVSYILRGEGLRTAGIIPIENLNEFVSDHLTNFLKAFTGLGLKDNKPPEGFDIAEETRVKIPRNMRYWVETQIPKWVDSCITAKGYQETVHYLVEDGQVKPVDYNTTGIVQDSTSWSGGLHQFLQIKHGLKMTSETVTTNFISNMAMFQKYSKSYTVVGELAGPSEFKSKAMERFAFQECNIVGLTGTLGSNHTRRMLRDLYNVKCVNLPQAHHLQYVQYIDNLVQSRNEWLSEIVHAADSEVMRDRGVLIICETIRDAFEVSKELKLSLPKAKTKLYTKNNAGQEGEIERIQPGEVLIATNLAGRGTDIKTDGIEEFGGLHVILTFLAMNVRVEQQAFGRTARQGRLGSGQLICMSAEASGGDMRQQRDAQQEAQLTEFLQKELPTLKAKDKCFGGFCSFLNKTRKYLRKEHGNESSWTKFKGFLGCGSDSPPTTIELNVIQAIEERWAMFLGIQLEGNRIPLNEAWGYYKLFELQINLDMKHGTTKVIRSPFYHISIGNHFLLKDCKTTNYINEAMENFNYATDFDSNFATAAHVGKGFCYLRGIRNAMRSDTHEDNCRTKAVACFNDALSQIQQELAYISSSQHLVLSNCTSGINTHLFEQITLKQNALKTYSNCIETAAQVAKSSLRGINITAIDGTTKREQFVPHMSKTFDYTDNTVDSCLDVLKHLAKTHKTFTLEFNDLTVSQDFGTKDQAKNTIDNCKELCASVDIICKEAYGLDSLLQVMSPDKYGNELPKAAAIQILTAWKATLSPVQKLKKMSTKKRNIDIDKDIGSRNVSMNDLTDLTFENANEPSENLSYELDYLPQVISPDKYGDELSQSAEIGTVQAFKETLSMKEKAKEMIMGKANTDVEIIGDQNNSGKILTDLTFNQAINQIKDLSETALVNLRYKSGNSEIHNVMKDVELRIELVDCNKSTVLQTLCLLTKTTIDLKVQSPNLEGFLKKLSPLRNKKVTLLKCNPDSSGWSSVIVPFPEAHLHKRKYENGEAIFKDLEINEAKDVTNFCGTKDFISVTINHLSKKSFYSSIDLLKENKRIFSKLKITLKNVHKRKYAEIISCFRNQLKHLQFSIVLNGLSIENAERALKNADLGMEPIQESKQTLLSDSFCSEVLPVTELWEFQLRGIYILCEFNEKSPIPWFSIGCVLGLAAIQLAIGGILVCTGFGASVGMGLITEGAADMFTAYRAYSNREFSWGNYATQKAIKLVFAAVSAGLTTVKEAAPVVESFVEEVLNRAENMALKSVTVSEAATRDELTSLVTIRSQLILSNYKSDVVRSVDGKVRCQFYTSIKLRKFLGLLWALDKLSQSKSLDSIIKRAVQGTLNPKSANFTALWNSVGLPLVQGIVSSSQQVGGIDSIGFRIAGILNGMKEFVCVIEKVIEVILENLEAENATDIAQILVRRLKIPLVEAKRIEISLGTETSDEMAYLKFEVGSQENKKISEYFIKLNLTQLDFKIEEMDMTIKWISDTLSEHILKVADSLLGAPVTAFLNGKFVSQVSAFVESNFKLNPDDLEDKNYATVSQQIHAQVKLYMIQHQQYETRRKIANAQENPERGQIPREVEDKIRKIIQGAPAGINEMFTLAKLEGKQLVILIDNDSIPQGNSSPDKVVVVFTTKSEGEGHYSLVDSHTGRRVLINSGKMDSGYAIFAHLNPGTTPVEMRLKIASFMHEYPEKFSNAIQNEAWIGSRFPEDAVKYLVKAGKKERGSNKKQSKKQSDDANQIEEQQSKRGMSRDIILNVTKTIDLKTNEGESAKLKVASVSKFPPNDVGVKNKNYYFSALKDERSEAQANANQKCSQNLIDNQRAGGRNEQIGLSLGAPLVNIKEYHGAEKSLTCAKNKMHEAFAAEKLHGDKDIIHKRHVDYSEQPEIDINLRPRSYGANNPNALPLLDKLFANDPLYKPKTETANGATFTDYEIKFQSEIKTGNTTVVPVEDRSDCNRYLPSESEEHYSLIEKELPHTESEGNHTAGQENVRICRKPEIPNKPENIPPRKFRVKNLRTQNLTQ